MEVFSPTLNPDLLNHLIELYDAPIWIKSSLEPESTKGINVSSRRLNPRYIFKIGVNKITSKSSIKDILLAFTADKFPACELDIFDPNSVRLNFFEPKIDSVLTRKIESLLELDPSLIIKIEGCFAYNSEQFSVWDKRFLGLAEEVSSWSKDPGTKVGCVLVDKKKRILSTGYNGFPVGFNDSLVEKMDREKKLAFTIHAEVNAIINAAKNGVNIENSTAYMTFHPCANCLSALINAGITTIICPDYNRFRPNPYGQFSFQSWLTNFRKTQDFLLDDLDWNITSLDNTFIKYNKRLLDSNPVT